MDEMETTADVPADVQQVPQVAAVDPDEVAEHNAKNVANRAKVGRIHAVAALAALVIFGAAHTWATSSGWLLATVTSIVAAFMAGVVLSALAHEWGHYSGALLSQSRVTVAEAPVNYFFMFNFDMATNDTRQAFWMSWGGLTGSWGLFLALSLLVTQDSWASAVLIATVFGSALNASLFEVPVVLRTRKSNEFGGELAAQLKSPGVIQFPGVIAGLALAVLLGLWNT